MFIKTGIVNRFERVTLKTKGNFFTPFSINHKIRFSMGFCQAPIDALRGKKCRSGEKWEVKIVFFA
jgi:hypothetical protein